MIKLNALLCHLAVLFVLPVLSSVYEAYPLGKQLPPVARLNKDFEFTISNETYKSSAGTAVEIKYQAFQLPEWLSFDSGSLKFSGVFAEDFLGEDDTKYFDVVLQGEDPSDSSMLNSTYQLVASKKSGVSIADEFNLLSLLKNYGYTNGKDALKLSPGEIFNVTFERDDFSSEKDDSIVSYYGRSSQYHAPLPNWLFFDPNNLKFSGIAPVVNSDIAPEMDYSFVLIATDIEGFSGTSINFQLVVGAHRLTTSIENTLMINVTESGSFSYEIPLDYVYLNDEPISQNDLGGINLIEAPDWISISDNNTLIGTMPQDSGDTKFQLSVYDKFLDVIYLNFVVGSTQDLFAVNSLSNVNVTRGEWFQYYLLPSQFTSYDETNVSAKISGDNDWLSFHSSNLTFYGTAPKDLKDFDVEVLATAGSREDSISFKMIAIDSHKSLTSSTTATTSSATSSGSTTSLSTSTSTSENQATSSAVHASPLRKSNKNTVAIVCGVVIPVVVILALLILFLLLWRRRKSKDKSDDEKFANISGPNPKNPANDPNAFAHENPFSDESTLESEVSVEAKRLATLNAMKLDELSNSSTATSLDEKNSHDSIYQDALMANSRDMLLQGDDESSVFDDKYRSSSVYFQNNPSQRKSWRYSKTKLQNEDRSMRQSYASLNTVSTQELLGSEIKEDSNLPHDPRKSSLGLRDSVFWSKDNQPAMLQVVDENSDKFKRVSSSTQSPKFPQSPHSSLSSDGFIPVKQNNGNYKWVPNDQPVRKKSTKRLGSVTENGGVNIGNANLIEGEEPERT